MPCFWLTLIDLALAANLLLIVLFSGYENFVSKLEIGDNADRPDWMGTVDFSGLKMKLIASIVAISGIALLKSFLSLGDGGEFDAVARDKLMDVYERDPPAKTDARHGAPDKL